MRSNLFDTEKLGLLLKSRWTDFIDARRLMLGVMERIRDTPLPEIQQDEIPKVQTSFTITDVSVNPYEERIEFVLEYSVPREKGVVVGTDVYALRLSGEVKEIDHAATLFLPKTE